MNVKTLSEYPLPPGPAVRPPEEPAGHAGPILRDGIKFGDWPSPTPRGGGR